jgi:hypothetical protein
VASERAKTVRDLDRSATVTGPALFTLIKIPKFKNENRGFHIGEDLECGILVDVRKHFGAIFFLYHQVFYFKI